MSTRVHRSENKDGLDVFVVGDDSAMLLHEQRIQRQNSEKGDNFITY